MQEDQEAEVKVTSTEEGFERFIEGTIWKDIRRELLIWSEKALRDFDEADTLEEVRRLQGIRQAINYMLQLPYQLREGLKRAREEEERRANFDPNLSEEEESNE